MDHLINFWKKKIRLLLSELCPFSTLTFCDNRCTVGGIVFYKHISSCILVWGWSFQVRFLLSELCSFSALTFCINKCTVGGIIFYKNIVYWFKAGPSITLVAKATKRSYYNGENNVSNFSQPVLIKSSNMQVTRTGTKFPMSLNFSEIRLLISELCALELRKLPHMVIMGKTLSPTFLAHI